MAQTGRWGRRRIELLQETASIRHSADHGLLRTGVNRTSLSEDTFHSLALDLELYEPPLLRFPSYFTNEPFFCGNLTRTDEKCYDDHDPTLTFVDREDDLDFLYEGFRSRRALMSCGHAVTPMSLTNWCQKLLDEGESRFVCGQTGCNVEWPYEEVCKMALLTPEEKKNFEKAMTFNANRVNIKPCPECKSPVVRADQSSLRVCCIVCTAKKKRVYDLCWQCLREWKGPASRSDRCENYGCSNESLKTLRTCPDITLKSVKFPSSRACPTCGVLLQHDNLGCTNVDCPRCKVSFCFKCLKLSGDCSVGYTQCHVAPRQTSIPVWKRK